MAANTYPIFTLTPNVGRCRITTTFAQPKSDGTSSSTPPDVMVKAFTAGVNGSYVDKVRFQSVASAATTGAATVLRAYLSTVADPSAGPTTNTNTFMLGEISVPAVPSASLTLATSPYEIPLNIAIPTGTYIHVAQCAAQTANQAWNAIIFGGDY